MTDAEFIELLWKWSQALEDATVERARREQEVSSPAQSTELIEIPFPVGSEVWLWWVTVGVDPVKRKVSQISIYLGYDGDPNAVKFSYNFEHVEGDGHRIYPDGLPLFTAYEDALAYREAWIEEFKKTNVKSPTNLRGSVGFPQCRGARLAPTCRM